MWKNALYVLCGALLLFLGQCGYEKWAGKAPEEPKKAASGPEKAQTIVAMPKAQEPVCEPTEKTVYRDRIIYRDKIVPEIREIEVPAKVEGPGCVIDLRTRMVNTVTPLGKSAVCVYDEATGTAQYLYLNKYQTNQVRQGLQ